MEQNMNIPQKSTLRFAQACDGNPVLSTATVILFFVLFNFFEAAVEEIIFGSSFHHILDPFIAAAFIAYAGYAVYWCAVFNTHKGV